MTPDEIKTLVLEFAEKANAMDILAVQGPHLGMMSGSSAAHDRMVGREYLAKTLTSLPSYQSLIAKEATESAHLAAYSDLEKAVRSGYGVAEALAAIDALSASEAGKDGAR